MANISVLMSVYYKEKPEYLKESLASLENQTLKANEIVIVKDGPLTNELDATINEFKKTYDGNVIIVPLEQNQGLGLALREGLLHCSNEIIARQDSDDISIPTRFEIEFNEIQKGYDIVGSHINEFINTTDNVVSKRVVPLTEKEIIAYQKKRCALNHMTVMFKKSKVLEAGNYEHCPLMEDDMLWVRMILVHAKMKNIDDFLVYARVGEDMFRRRGGYAYFKKYKSARKKIYKLGFISFFQYLETNIIQFIVCIMPNSLRQFIFVKLLRK